MSPRRRIEAILLAVIAVFSVWPLRIAPESKLWFSLESVCLLLAFASHQLLRKRDSTRGLKYLAPISIAGIVATPVVFAIVSRHFGSRIAFEISALSTFAAMSLAIASAATTARVQAMSIVASGFLVLFATSISDWYGAVLIAVVWISICVWYLIANHWERLDLRMPDSVRLSVGVRPASVLSAVLLCLLGGWLAAGRITQSRKLGYGWMPTSGGSRWSDPAARSGVGTGEAAIAAKDHAESFGAVESDIFLESNESTLFDMFNDMIGEPKLKKNKWERRQGMGSENVIENHEKASKTEKGGNSFSTKRMPAKKHAHLKDSVSNAVIQWSGPTGIRLALERFDHFDGSEWTNLNDRRVSKLPRRDFDESVWFFDPTKISFALEHPESVSVNLVKILRLKSTSLPVPMMTAGIHIRDIDRQDFFGIDEGGSLYMPGREKIPPLTVVNAASVQLLEDELLQLSPSDQQLTEANSHRQLRELVARIAPESETTYERLCSIIEFLRSDFEFDRSVGSDFEDPVVEFLNTKRGGDHLFATTAVLMAKELGLESRLVTGFYVRPSSFDLSEGYANILPQDVHVWGEVKLSDGRWFEIEPSPGYQSPVYTPSIWLRTKRFAATYWLHTVAGAALLFVLYFTRLIWVEWILTLLWSLSRILTGKRQLRVAMCILGLRAWLTGNRRPVGTPQRDWVLLLASSDSELTQHAEKFCDEADHYAFGNQTTVRREEMTRLVKEMTTLRLKHVRQELAA